MPKLKLEKVKGKSHLLSPLQYQSITITAYHTWMYLLIYYLVLIMLMLVTAITMIPITSYY